MLQFHFEKVIKLGVDFIKVEHRAKSAERIQNLGENAKS
jgi:hypothetical protein